MLEDTSAEVHQYYQSADETTSARSTRTYNWNDERILNQLWDEAQRNMEEVYNWRKSKEPYNRAALNKCARKHEKLRDGKRPERFLYDLHGYRRQTRE